MYHYLEGILAQKNPVQIVVDVAGVGYELTIPLSTYSLLPEPGQAIHILTHFHVREDHQQLFGFMTADERDLFRLLLSVSGVGPKVAMAILSGLPAEEFKNALVDGNVAVLSGISGVGKKTAERLVVELREKVISSAAKGKSSKHSMVSDMIEGNAVAEDALLALVSLGYKRSQARDAVNNVVSQTKGRQVKVEEVIREALKKI